MSSIKQVTDSEFQTEVLNSDKPVLVDFWAPWCGPCRAIAPVIDELAQQFSEQLSIVKINVDENPETAAKYEVLGIPTLALFKNGEFVAKKTGAHPKSQLVTFIEEHC